MLLLLALYLLVGAAAVGAVRWLRRPAPLRYVAVFWLLPVVFAFPGFFADRTILPVDHGMLILPWYTLGPTERHNPNLNDIATHMVPWAKAVRMAWKEGSPPWRQRWNGCGMALAANGQSAAFSPFTFLMFALPLARAFTLLAAVKLFLALFGMWLWLSELGVSRTSALFGAVCFGLSCVMTPWILFPHTAVICLWPWALFSIELLQEEQDRRRAFWALTAVFFFWALAGHPESAALGGIFAVLWLLGRAAWRDLPRPGRVLGRVALAAAIALGLSAFLLVPQALAIAQSSRIPVAREFARNLPVRAVPHGPFWPNGFFTVVFPRSLGDTVGGPMIAGGAGSFPEMALGYFGILGWAVALGMIRPGSHRKRAEFPLLVLLVAGLGVGVALWPFFEIAVLAPVLRMMFVLRYFSWVALAGAAIAAFELDRLRADSLAGSKSSFAFLAILVGLAAYALLAYNRFHALHAASGGLASQMKAFAVACVCLGAAAVIFLVARWRPSPFRLTLAALALSAVAAAELLYQGARLYKFGSPGDLYPDTPMLAFLRSRPGPFRVVGEGTTLFPNTNIFAGVEDIRTKDPVERLDYVEFLNATCGYPPAEEFKQIGNINASVLDFLNVRYLVSAPGRAAPSEKWRGVYSGTDGTVFENSEALPRIFAPGAITIIDPPNAPRPLIGDAFERFGAPAFALSKKTDWRDHAFVLGTGAQIVQNGTVQVSGYRESTNRVSFHARVQGEPPGAFLVTSLLQDGGWTATTGTDQIESTLTNGPFLAFQLPKGDHEVRLAYSPPGYGAGLLITLACLTGTAIATVRRSAVGRRALRALAPSPRLTSVSRVLLSPRTWLAGATAVLIAGVGSSRWNSPGSAFHVPATPIDFTSPGRATLWNFLTKVADAVPAGASYTVLAPNRDEEMVLYMFSLGILRKQKALPSSYAGNSSAGVGGLARYVIVFGPARPEVGSARLIREVPEGAVYERSGGR